MLTYQDDQCEPDLMDRFEDDEELTPFMIKAMGLSLDDDDEELTEGLAPGEEDITAEALDQLAATPTEAHLVAEQWSLAKATSGVTEVWLAELFARLRGMHHRYVSEWRSWISWDGRCWKTTCADGPLDELASINQVLYREQKRQANLVESDRERQQVLAAAEAWVKRFNSCNGLLNVLRLARQRCQVSASDLNRSRGLLNCGNGTLELDSGLLRPHNPDDLLTQLIPIDYDPQAKCPRFETLVDWCACGESDLTGYIQRALGYSISGRPNQQVMFILHGEGANGKSTLLDAVMAAIDPLGERCMSSTVLSRRNDGSNSDDVAALHGKRLALISEPDLGNRLDESKIKLLTGTDRITAMRKYQSPFSFEPTHVLMVDTNHLPAVHGTDYGIRRRLQTIPFRNTITETQRDPDLLDKLKTELPGILRWLVDGYRQYLTQGLCPPQCAQDATSAYLAENDQVGTFLEECCVVDSTSDIWVKTDELYANYSQWAKDNGYKYPLTAQNFKRDVGQRPGIRKTKRRIGPDQRVPVFEGLRVTKHLGLDQRGVR